VHVTADWKNCFLIIVLSAASLQPESFILFDIGAEYQQSRFVCPAFDIDDVPGEDTIRTCLPRLQGQHDPFAIIDRGEGTYMQTYAENGMFDLEHQLVSTSAHYRLAEPVDVATAVRAMLSYAFGKKEWAREFVWQKMEL
jgi:hypothetical protein